MKTVSALLCVAFCLFVGLPESHAGSICSASPNLVANCGFETGDFTSWTLSGNDVPGELGNLYGVEFGADPIDGILPNSGSYQAYFADLVSNATTISQTIPTSVGTQYAVSWYLAQDTAPSTEYSNLFSASFGGVSLVSLTAMPVQGYTFYSYVAAPTSSSSVLSLTLGNGLGEFLLDDVTVTAAPEPAAWTLVLAGVLACIFGRKLIARGLHSQA